MGAKRIRTAPTGTTPSRLVICVSALKGAMTKSTTTVNIAAALAERGGRGCVVDTDTRQLDASRFARLRARRSME